MQKSDPSRSPYWQAVAAGALLTRLPLPHAPEIVFRRQARTVWAYPVWGLILGAIAAGFGALTLWLTGVVVLAAIVALAVATLLSGAMHEDGLADTADGFWGGYTPERRLEIMKDSHIGTYGVLALVISSFARIAAVSALVAATPLALIAAMVLSRAMMPVVMCALPHARHVGLSRSVGRPVVFAAMLSVVVGACIAIVLTGLSGLWAMFIALAVTLGLVRVARAKIGGQTGDVVGATQVLTEITVLVVMLTLLPA